MYEISEDHQCKRSMVMTEGQPESKESSVTNQFTSKSQLTVNTQCKLPFDRVQALCGI